VAGVPVTVGPLEARAGRLASFLKDYAGREFSHGVADCAIMVADWIRSETGRDPAADLRGRYSRERDWRRIVDEAGGMVALYDVLAMSVGLRHESVAKVGDIAVVVADGQQFGAIRTPDRWAVKLSDGLTSSGDFMPIAIWQVPI